MRKSVNFLKCSVGKLNDARRLILIRAWINVLYFQISYTYMLPMLLITCVQVSHARGMATGDEMRPGYGTKFSQVGKMIQGLNRYDLVIGI